MSQAMVVFNENLVGIEDDLPYVVGNSPRWCGLAIFHSCRHLGKIIEILDCFIVNVQVNPWIDLLIRIINALSNGINAAIMNISCFVNMYIVLRLKTNA